MITLKQALGKSKDELADIKKDLTKKIEETKDINAYIGMDCDNNDGVPILIKDNISVKDWSLTCASKILQGYKAPYSATAILNMQNSGMSAFGRSNMDEFAMGSSTASSFYGKTLNPHDKTKVPGGSSGGSAAAVAAGAAIAALGSDTGGSVRQPAALCGVVGMKPTYGRVSRYGLAAYGSSLDQIGVFGQNVEDSAILYDAIAGFDIKDSTSANIECKKVAPNLNLNRKINFAVIDNFIDQASPSVKNSINALCTELEKAGHKVIRTHMMNSKYDVAAYYITATAEAATNLQRYDGVRYGQRADCKNVAEMFINSRSDGFGDEVQRRILLGNFVLSSGYYDAYYVKAQKTRELIKREYAEIFANSEAILLPVTPSVAFGFDAHKEPLEMYLEDIYTIGVNLAGLPGISVPVGYDSNLPIGVQILTNHFEEQTLFDAAFAIENICAFKNKLI